MHVNMHIDNFADFMFLKNTQDAIIDLSLGGIESSKDLFCFLVDLLCKGLVLLFGSNGSVELESITENDFELVVKKMSNAGIKVMIEVKPNHTGRSLGIVFDEQANFPKLEEYFMDIIANDRIYHIRFELIHQITM